MLKVNSPLKFVFIITPDNFCFILLNLIFKVMNKIVRSDFMTPILSIFLEFLNVVGENGDIRLGAMNEILKFD